MQDFDAIAVENLYWLDQLQVRHRSLVGGKALRLGLLLQDGYPVLPGCVLPAPALRQFLGGINWLEPLFTDLPDSALHLDPNNPRQLQEVARHVRQTLTRQPLPPALQAALPDAIARLGSKTVILRPSIEVQPPPQQPDLPHSQLMMEKGIGTLLPARVCWATPAAVTAGIQQQWADLFSAASLFLWQRLGVSLQNLHLAILIQPIFPAQAAGTAWVRDREIEIAATAGLGMALGQGLVTPDRYWLDEPDGTLRHQTIGKQTVVYTIDATPAPQSPALRMTPLAAPRPAQILSPATLQTLQPWLQRLRAEQNTDIEVEWSLGPPGTSDIYLHQVIRQHVTSPPAPSSMAAPTAHAAGELLDTAMVGAGLATAPGRAIAPVFCITDDLLDAQSIPPGRVLVAPNLAADWLLQVPDVVAVVTEQGGMTCHSAIIARELGVPAVMSAIGITAQLKSGDWVLVDGNQGRVYQVSEGTQMASDHPSFGSPALTQLADTTPIRTTLMVNLSQVAALKKIEQLPIAGIGLLRSELLAVNILDNQHPDEWLRQGRADELIQRLAQQVAEFTAALAPHPVFFRALDLRTHEFAHLAGALPPPEVNPMLGIRGTFSYLLNPQLLDMQLLALAEVQRRGGKNLRLILPFVRTVEEFQFCRQRVQQAGLLHQPDFQLWIMAEVPSVLFLLPDYVKAGVQGISIGTNDLTQLLLGVDRDHGQMAVAFSEQHPAVLDAIAQLIQWAHQLGIPCSICGQAPARYPEMVTQLVNWGIDTISVEPEAIERTYRAIVQAEQNLEKAP